MAEQLVGYSETGWAVWGSSVTGTGMVGTSPSGVGAYGGTRYGKGVYGLTSREGVAVYGRHNGSGHAVQGDIFGDGAVGVGGYSHGPRGIGVEGWANGPTSIGVWGTVSNPAARLQKAGSFNGDVEIRGYLTVINGTKAFKIDHPLDPENKYLLHNAVESSERKNVYDGVAYLDQDGSAWVDLPEWFEALNGDFRYQLTPVGGSAPDLHIAEEISENHFKIGGGPGGMKVCWQVTGSRKEPWAAANAFEVEEEKREEERGRYLQPDLYDAPADRRVMMVPNEEERLRELESPPPTAQAPEMPLGFAAPGFGSLEEENRRQIDELRKQIEELKRQR